VLKHDAVALPAVIQGGMGVAVSSWSLARAVSAVGQLGVVSGTALDAVLARRLQDGDPGGHMRAALAAFPLPAIAERILSRYFRPGGRAPGTPYAPVPRLRLHQDPHVQELIVAANFAEVWLAKQRHQGPVGINYLDKIRMALPAAAYGAMLAEVDVVLAGAGIPRELPALLTALARLEPVSLPVDVADAAEGQRYAVSLDPAALSGSSETARSLKRPAFLAVVSSHVLAEYMARDPAMRPDGFVVEGPMAGGHNAPPRGRLTLDEEGEPCYGPRDHADLARLAAIGLPFWLAGSCDTPARLAEARAAGAAGVQVGTLFALCRESGLRADLRAQLLDQARQGTLRVRTDPAASPTGFPFKVVKLPGTLAELERYSMRPRLCDLGHLRVPFVRPGGGIGYRCPGEPVHTYLRKGGDVADTEGRTCLCNALLANVGLAQTRHGGGYTEEPLVTLGSALDGVSAMLRRHPAGWSAAEVVTWLLAGSQPETAHPPGLPC
jgi:NAD(P)H-dependent flavin oxidoreductase YrpB (nitropropane dioxygenase family)